MYKEVYICLPEKSVSDVIELLFAVTFMFVWKQEKLLLFCLYILLIFVQHIWEKLIVNHES